MNAKSDAPADPVIFENAAVTSRQRDHFLLGSMFLALGWAPVAIEFIWPDFGDGEVIVAFVVVGLGLYLSAVYQLFTRHKKQHERIALVFDKDGIGGANLFANPDERMSWTRIQSVEIDGAAVVVGFKPKDMTSQGPADRRSLVRLSVADRMPEEIAATISKFWQCAG